MVDEECFNFLPFSTAGVPGGTLKSGCAVLDGWPAGVHSALSALARGPEASGVASWDALAQVIVGMRREAGFHDEDPRLAKGISFSFDEVLSVSETGDFFNRVLPGMASLVLRLPALVAEQASGHGGPTLGQAGSSSACSGSSRGDGSSSGVYTGEGAEGGGALCLSLRILNRQEAGTVLMTQELAAALLCAAFYCLFPTAGRAASRLPEINFDQFYGSLYQCRASGHPVYEAQKAKLRCLVNYYSRIASATPEGRISFERKVLPLGAAAGSSGSSHPGVDFWETRSSPLCPLTVEEKGSMEDGGLGCLQVDFANAYLGGGALEAGCVQEEILFMICPELIVGMLFMPAMAANETVEIVGAERFSAYSGYADSFACTGNFQDPSPRDHLGRRRRHIVAMDALCHPGGHQFCSELLLREVNKAFCGFLDHKALSGDTEVAAPTSDNGGGSDGLLSSWGLATPSADGTSGVGGEGGLGSEPSNTRLGVATGNWGCGAFGGDLQLKAMLQWIAASEAGHPRVLYFTFGDKRASGLQEVADWVSQQGWTVGRLWKAVATYSHQRLQQETGSQGLFDWLLVFSGKETGETSTRLEAAVAQPATPRKSGSYLIPHRRPRDGASASLLERVSLALCCTLSTMLSS